MLFWTLFTVAHGIFCFFKTSNVSSIPLTSLLMIWSSFHPDFSCRDYLLTIVLSIVTVNINLIITEAALLPSVLIELNPEFAAWTPET